MATFRVAGHGSGTGTSWSITLPAGIQAGDAILLGLGSPGGVTQISSITGFVKLGEILGTNNNGGNCHLEVWYKRASGTSGTSPDAGSTVTVATSTGATFNYSCSVYGNVHNQTPSAQGSSAAQTGSSTTLSESFSYSNTAGSASTTHAYLLFGSTTHTDGTLQFTLNSGAVMRDNPADAPGTQTSAAWDAPGPTSSGSANLIRSVNPGATEYWLEIWAAVQLEIAQAPSNPGAFTNPTAGQVVNTNDTLAWGASSDPEGGTVTYSVDYSGDGGSTWTNIGDGITGTSYTYDFSVKTATTNAKVRVKAHSSVSGLDSGYTSSSTFTVSHYYPVMVI